MRRIEKAYLLAVATMLLVFCILTLHRNTELQGLWHKSATATSIGKPRTVNIEQIRLLLNQGKLADKEAKFYTTSPAMEE